MMETEYKKLIDRDKYEKDAKVHYAKQLELLEDLVNYGSWLIPRAFDASEKRLKDIVIIGVLLKQVVAMLDALEILVRSGSVHAAHLQLRAMFEASLYLDWIIQDDSEERASYYYVSDIRRQLLWALRILEGTSEQKVFSTDMADFARVFDLKSPELQALAKTNLMTLDQRLKEKRFCAVNEKIARTRGKGKFEPSWYRALGKQSLGSIAKDVGRFPEYTVIYEQGSLVAHGSSYRDHVEFKGKGNVAFKPLRWLDSADYLIRVSTSIVLGTYLSVLRRYRKGELTNFGKKYIDSWRGPFQHIPTVKYELSDIPVK
jgi:hypothetical protein